MFQSAHECILLNSAFGTSTPSSFLYTFFITLILNTHLPEELQSELAKSFGNKVGGAVGPIKKNAGRIIYFNPLTRLGPYRIIDGLDT